MHRALLEHHRALECNLYALGNVYLGQKRYVDALRLHQEVLERFGGKLGHQHHVVADSCHKIGNILGLGAGVWPEGSDWPEAAKYLRKALSIYEYAWNQRNFNTRPSAARTKWKLAQVLRAMGQDDRDDRDVHRLVVEADELRRQAVAFLEEKLGAAGEVMPAVDDEVGLEGRFDELVFYWSR